MIAPDSEGLHRSEPELSLWVIAFSGQVLLPLAGLYPFPFDRRLCAKSGIPVVLEKLSFHGQILSITALMEPP